MSSRNEHFLKEKNILCQVAKASDAIRRKHRLLKLGKETVEQTLSETFKPIINPLEKIVGDLENIKKVDPIKIEKEEVKSEVKENVDDYDDDDDGDLTFKSFDNEQGDEKEDSSNLELSTLNETETTLEPSCSSSWKDDTNNYLILLGERSKDLDNVYG